ncbi:hypothetical protein PRECH8_12840 [Insulibacter thermoxylanivorax]|uniref:ABC-2 type transporter transmembrane domain-containing protein n=1 Tax=Insulibacter thermoxylanivorax TaxID=2749268 RepID=A0A916VFK7_9BACL|nr:ABC transporter permease [Insulibacter thermoxylanivorax]GFR37988.1 hypothetical protein PRECH8_12840 [Insulibacter thermoxylanivorax]
MSKLGSVIRFTFWSQARTRGFIIGTVFFCLLITIGIHLPLIIQAFNFGGTDKIAVLPSSSQLPAALHAFYTEQEEAEIEIILLDDQGSFEANEALAKEMLFSGEIDGYLIIPGDEQTIAAEAQFKSKDAGSSVQNKLQTALQFLRTSMVAAQFQLSGEELAELNRTFIVESIHIMENDAGKSEQEIAMTIVFVFVMLSMLFGSIFGGGAMVATEVSSEKSSRVMEILITSVKPMVQMFGKVIGVFLIGFVQILIYAAVAIINLMLPYNREAFANFNLDLSALSISMLLYFILFYLIGYFAYAVLFAAAGSIVSRTEDVNQVISPIMVLSLLTFYVAIFSVSNAGALYVEILSFVPLFTPVLMFLRIGLSDPAIWEIVLAVAVNIGFIVVTGWLAAKIYRAGVLMYGKRPALKEVWKAMRYY